MSGPRGFPKWLAPAILKSKFPFKKLLKVSQASSICPPWCIYSGSLRNQATDRSFVFEYTVSSANTWEQKSITIVGVNNAPNKAPQNAAKITTRKLIKERL